MCLGDTIPTEDVNPKQPASEAHPGEDTVVPQQTGGELIPVGMLPNSKPLPFAVSKDAEKKTEEEKYYALFVYYIPTAVNRWRVDFVVVWNLDIYLEVCPGDVYFNNSSVTNYFMGKVG